jgi:vacuolar-type H+-ATPase subunit E/Vma4
MNPKQVIDKILAEANAEADKIKAGAATKITEEQGSFDAEITRYKSQTQEMAEAAAEDAKLRMLASARMSLKKGNASVRSDLLNEVFDKARVAVMTMADAEYVKLMSGLMVKAAIAADQKVIVGKDESRINAAMIKDVNRQLKTDGKGELTLSSTKAGIDGGFILSSGNVRMNVSIDVLVSQAREDLELELAEELFA